MSSCRAAAQLARCGRVGQAHALICALASHGPTRSLARASQHLSALAKRHTSAGLPGSCCCSELPASGCPTSHIRCSVELPAQIYLSCRLHEVGQDFGETEYSYRSEGGLPAKPSCCSSELPASGCPPSAATSRLELLSSNLPELPCA
jgi:hypothetical protein